MNELGRDTGAVEPRRWGQRLLGLLSGWLAGLFGRKPAQNSDLARVMRRKTGPIVRRVSRVPPFTPR